MTEEVKRYLQKSQRSLRVADELLAKGYFDDSCSKSYYVMFYAAQALLKNSGVDVIKHSAVVAKFGECLMNVKHYSRPTTIKIPDSVQTSFSSPKGRFLGAWPKNGFTRGPRNDD
ncbi:MAG: HEPN domain-containing protein, partial [Candidatus Aminicenantes bacterium]|nr:HEPN domain-containing protein [Candidatus Aminicenantes bacterium]